MSTDVYWELSAHEGVRSSFYNNLRIPATHKLLVYVDTRIQFRLERRFDWPVQAAIKRKVYSK